MHEPSRSLTESEAQIDANRQTGALAGFAIILLLLVCGLFLVHTLHNSAIIEDCLLMGARDCDRLVVSGR